MKIKTISNILLAAVAATLVAGCDSMLKKEHEKTAKGATEQWLQAKQGIQYEVAVQEYKVGDYDKCRESLKSALATAAPTAQILTLAAKIEMEQGGNLERASAYLKHAVETNGAKGVSDAEPLYLLGVVYQRWQQLETACDYYEQAAQKKSTEATYVVAAIEMKIALGRLDEAKDYIQTKMNFFEQSAAMRMALARIALLQNDPAQAAVEFREATLLTPEDRSIRWSYASALYDAGKYNDAAKILEAMRREEPMPTKVANTKKEPQDLKIEEETQKADRISLLMLLGESYVALNRPLDARDCFQETIRIQPENKSAYLSLGKACLMNNDYTLAIAATKHVLRSDPKNVDAMILQAAAQQKQKKWNDALDTLADAAKLSPRDATVLCMQGLSELQLGKKDIAVSLFEKAVAISPTDTWANDLLSQVKPPSPAAPEAPTAPAAAPGTVGAGPEQVRDLFAISEPRGQ